MYNNLTSIVNYSFILFFFKIEASSMQQFKYLYFIIHYRGIEGVLVSLGFDSDSPNLRHVSNIMLTARQGQEDEPIAPLNHKKIITYLPYTHVHTFMVTLSIIKTWWNKLNQQLLFLYLEYTISKTIIVIMSSILFFYHTSGQHEQNVSQKKNCGVKSISACCL